MSWSKPRDEAHQKQLVDTVEALANTILEEKLGASFKEIQFSKAQSKEIVDRIRQGDKLDAISSESYLLSNELAAFNSNPDVVRALRVACEFVRAGELISDGMETNERLSVKLSNSKLYSKIVKRTGQVHLAASAAMTFFAIKTTWSVYASETEGSTAAKISAISNTTERLGDLGGDVFETITELRMVSDSKWLTSNKMKTITKGLHIVFTAAEVVGKGAEHIRYIIDEDAPLYMKITSTLSVLLDSGGLALGVYGTQTAVEQVEAMQEELNAAAARRIGKAELGKGDDMLKILPKNEVDDIVKKFPIKKTAKGALIGAQIAFLAADIITGASSLHALSDHQKNLLQAMAENPTQEHYKLLSAFYEDRYKSDLGFFAGRTAIDVVFTSMSTAVMLTGLGIPLALAIDLVGATISSVLSYAQQAQIESLVLKRVKEIQHWENAHPGQNYFDHIFKDRYEKLTPLLEREAKAFLESYKTGDRAFVVSQFYTTEQINEAVGLFYKNKNGISSDRLFVGEFIKNDQYEVLKQVDSKNITLDQKNGIIKIDNKQDSKHLFYASPNQILLPGQVRWKEVDPKSSNIVWKEVKKTFSSVRDWLKENVFNANDKNRLGAGTAAGVAIDGSTDFFAYKENEHLFIENIKDWDIDLGNNSSVADLTRFTTRIAQNKIETYQEYVPDGGYMYASSGHYVQRKKVVLDDPKIIKIKAKSGDGNDTYMVGTGSHEIDAGEGANRVDYGSINEQSSIHIKIDKSKGYKTLLSEKVISGIVYEESVGKQPVLLGAKKYNTQYRIVEQRKVADWKTQDLLKNFQDFRLGKGHNSLDLTQEDQNIDVELTGHTNNIKLGQGADNVIVDTNTQLLKKDARKNHIRTREGRDRIVVKMKHAKEGIPYYNENFICGGTDLDANGNPIQIQSNDTLEYAITGDYGKNIRLWGEVFKDVGGDVYTPGWMEKFKADKKYKFGSSAYMKNQYGDRADLHGTKEAYATLIRSQYGVSVTWHNRKDLNVTSSFYKDLKILSDNEGYLKIKRYAPELQYKSDKEIIAVASKKLVGTDYVVHIETLHLTNDDDEVNIKTAPDDHSLNIFTGDGYDQINLGKGFYTILTGQGSKVIKLGDGYNTVIHHIDELEDVIEAKGKDNWLKFQNNFYLFNKDEGKRVITHHRAKKQHFSNLGVQVDLKAEKSNYYFEPQSIQDLAEFDHQDYENNLQFLDDQSKATIETKYGVGDSIIGFNNISGTKLNDIILGNEENNIIETEDGDDLVNAREGDDDIRLGLGADIGYGGSGDDLFIQDYDNAQDILDGGEGSNCVDYSKAVLPSDKAKTHGGLTIDLQKGEAYLADETKYDLIRKIQNAIGTKYNDKFVGDNGDNYFKGLDGTNQYEGNGGNNYFYGGKDQDVYIGGKDGGYDTINDEGGENDVYRLNIAINKAQSFIEREKDSENNFTDNLIMRFNNGAKKVKVNGQFDGNNNKGIEYLQFANGDAYKMSDLLTGSAFTGPSQTFNSFDWSKIVTIPQS